MQYQPWTDNETAHHPLGAQITRDHTLTGPLHDPNGAIFVRDSFYTRGLLVFDPRGRGRYLEPYCPRCFVGTRTVYVLPPHAILHPNLRARFPFGRAVYACSRAPECDFWEWVDRAELPSYGHCPVCGWGRRLLRHMAYPDDPDHPDSAGVQDPGQIVRSRRRDDDDEESEYRDYYSDRDDVMEIFVGNGRNRGPRHRTRPRPRVNGYHSDEEGENQTPQEFMFICSSAVAGPEGGHRWCGYVESSTGYGDRRYTNSRGRRQPCQLCSRPCTRLYSPYIDYDVSDVQMFLPVEVCTSEDCIYVNHHVMPDLREIEEQELPIIRAAERRRRFRV